MSRKLALVIGVSEYDDPTLATLRTPSADVDALARALRDTNIGNFDEVEELVNQTAEVVRRAISVFFTNKKPDDLLLLYFSGHGVLNDRGRLFLAVKSSVKDLLTATAIPSTFITEEMDTCRSKRQVLILDCCHSGAFERGRKGEQKVITETTFEGNGYGRVVLTASDATQYAFEGDRVIEKAELSLFTHHLIQGLLTGDADSNRDGLISLDDWYSYAYTQVLNETPKQTPKKWVYNQEGELIIAKAARYQSAKAQETSSSQESQGTFSEATAHTPSGRIPSFDFNSNAPDSVLVERVLVVLGMIADQFSAWGELMDRTDQPPHITIVKEIAQGLDNFLKEQRSLNRWLEKRRKQQWGELYYSLKESVNSFNDSGTKSALSTYIQWREDQYNKGRGNREARLYSDLRFKAAKGFLELADNIHLTIEIIQASRLQNE